MQLSFKQNTSYVFLHELYIIFPNTLIFLNFSFDILIIYYLLNDIISNDINYRIKKMPEGLFVFTRFLIDK